MIYGIGVDCTRIERIQKSMQRERFLNKVFTQKEKELFAQRGEKHAAEGAAGCFAAKEAFLKSLGVGLGSFDFLDIAALRKQSGAPYFELYGKAKEFCEQNHLVAHLSITHDGGMAIAMVVMEKDG